MKARHPMNPADMPVGMLINDISKFFHDRMRRESEKIGIRSGYRPLLFHLAHGDDITQLELVHATRLKASTISVTLTEMERDGLIERHSDPDDLRQTRVSITEKGRALDDAMREKIHETEQLMVEGITEEEQAQLKEILIKMYCRLRSEREGRPQ